MAFLDDDFIDVSKWNDKLEIILAENAEQAFEIQHNTKNINETNNMTNPRSVNAFESRLFEEARSRRILNEIEAHTLLESDTNDIATQAAKICNLKETKEAKLDRLLNTISESTTKLTVGDFLNKLGVQHENSKQSVYYGPEMQDHLETLENELDQYGRHSKTKVSGLLADLKTLVAAENDPSKLTDAIDKFLQSNFYGRSNDTVKSVNSDQYED